MTAPYIHDLVFDDIRKNGPDRPIAPADASRVGQRQPKATAGELGRQTMRGLGRAGINTAVFLPELITEIAEVPGAPFINQYLVRPFIEKHFTQPQLQELDEFWGLPETGGGRGAAILGELVGSVAVPLGPTTRIPRTFVDASKVVRTRPAVRAATDAEIKKVTAALRRAPAGSPERRLLDDLMGPQLPASRGTAVVRQDLEDILNLRAFGRTRGPFVHPERAVPTAEQTLGFPPTKEEIARRAIAVGSRVSRESAEFNKHQIKHMEDRINAAYRDQIIKETKLPQRAGRSAIPLRPTPGTTLKDLFPNFFRNEKGEIPIGPTEQQLANIRARPRIDPSKLSNDDIVWALDRQDLMAAETAKPWKAVLSDGTEIRGATAEDVVAQAGYERTFNLTHKDAPRSDLRIQEYAQARGAEDLSNFRRGGYLSGEVELLFENRYGQELRYADYASEIDKLRSQLRNRPSGAAGASILSALTATGAAGTTAAALKGKKKP